MTDKKITINIATGTIIKVVFTILLLIFLYLTRDLIAVILLSVVIASGVEPAAVWLQKRKIPRTPAVIFIYLITFVAIGLMFYIIIPAIFSEFSSFVVKMDAYFERPAEQNVLDELLAVFPSSISGLLRNFAADASQYLENFKTDFSHGAASLFGGAVSLVLVVVLSFYLSVQEKGIENFLRIIIPIKHEEYIIDLWLRARRKIGLWLQGQFLLGVIIAVLSFLGLSILGIEYALAFALLAGMFELIPVFGPILASIPPIAVALSISPILALKVLILYIVVQQFENHLIYPLVVRKIVGIPPIMTILALVAGAKLAGLIGMLLAVPVVTILVEILNDIDHKKHRAAG